MENTVDRNKVYTLEEALKILPTLSKSKFVGSVDLDIVLNVKENQKKEVVRGSVSLPHSFGEEKKVIVFCEEADADKAIKAGASKAGLETLMKEVIDGWNDFDVVIAAPAVMAKIVRAGKVLGPRGLMPNPKNGTVTDDFEKAVSSFKSGRMNFKTAQDQPVIRLKAGKIDMEAASLQANIVAVMKGIFAEAKRLNASPFKKVSIKPTMGASLKLDVNDIIKQF